MADTTILAAGSESLPAGYTVPAAQVIQPKSVRAVIDGTGASGDFVPVLQIVSDSGIVIAEGVCSTTVSAGGSAQVSWFPHVGAASATAAAGQTWALLTRNLSFSAPATTITKIQPDASTFYTSDSSVFDVSTNVITGDTGIVFKQYGHYLTFAWAFQTAGGTAAQYGIEIYQDGGVGVHGLGGNPYVTTTASSTQGETAVTQWRIVEVASAETTLPTARQIWAIDNVGGVAVQMYLGAIVIVQLDATDSVLP